MLLLLMLLLMRWSVAELVLGGHQLVPVGVPWVRLALGEQRRASRVLLRAGGELEEGFDLVHGVQAVSGAPGAGPMHPGAVLVHLQARLPAPGGVDAGGRDEGGQ